MISNNSDLPIENRFLIPPSVTGTQQAETNPTPNSSESKISKIGKMVLSFGKTIAPAMTAVAIAQANLYSRNPKSVIAMIVGGSYSVYRGLEAISDKLGGKKPEEKRSLIATELAHIGSYIEGTVNIAAGTAGIIALESSTGVILHFTHNYDTILTVFRSLLLGSAYTLQKTHVFSKILSKIAVNFQIVKPTPTTILPQPEESKSAPIGSDLTIAKIRKMALSFSKTVAPGIAAVTAGIYSSNYIHQLKTLPVVAIMTGTGYAAYRTLEAVSDRLGGNDKIVKPEEKGSRVSTELAHLKSFAEGTAHIAAGYAGVLALEASTGFIGHFANPDAVGFSLLGGAAYGLHNSHAIPKVLSAIKKFGSDVKVRFDSLSTRKKIMAVASAAALVAGGILLYKNIDWSTSRPSSSRPSSSGPSTPEDDTEEEYNFSEFAFRRFKYMDDNSFNPEIASSVVKVLETKTDDFISFSEDDTRGGLDRPGTCSAMALDFTARFINKCAPITDPDALKDCVREFSPFYTTSTNEFASRQVGYNSIRIAEEALDNPQVDITAQKMSALAHFHDMKLEPVMELMSTHSHQLTSIIKELKNGDYVIRLLQPDDGHKQELFGHSMAFFKRDKMSVFYNNADGALLIKGNPLNEFVNGIKMHYSYIPQVRIYKATCLDACKNLAGSGSGTPGYF